MGLRREQAAVLQEGISPCTVPSPGTPVSMEKENPPKINQHENLPPRFITQLEKLSAVKMQMHEQE